MDPDSNSTPDPAIFVNDLQDGNKNFVFLSFFAGATDLYPGEGIQHKKVKAISSAEERDQNT
jgi:hypothetical protein